MATEDQTEGDIASLAEKAARELLEVMPTLKLANPIERGMEISEALRAENSSAARLMAVFRDDSSFGNLHGGWIQQHGGFGMAAQGHAVPVLLINSVIDGHSTKSLIEEARAFAGSQTSITESYTPLAGATVAEAVSLDDNIDLVPWADVPDGNQKTVFGPGGAYDGLALLTSILRPRQAFANSAVRIRSADCQVLFSSSKDAEAVLAQTGHLLEDALRPQGLRMRRPRRGLHLPGHVLSQARFLNGIPMGAMAVAGTALWLSSAQKQPERCLS